MAQRSAFIFCVGDPFESEPTPTSADKCGEVTGCDASHQEVSRWNTWDGSQGMYITFASTKVNKAEPTLALKPRGDITRNPKQGYHWPQNRTCVCVRQTYCFKKRDYVLCLLQMERHENEFERSCIHKAANDKLMK